jgi:hypothetical protein
LALATGSAGRATVVREVVPVGDVCEEALEVVERQKRGEEWSHDGQLARR